MQGGMGHHQRQVLRTTEMQRGAYQRQEASVPGDEKQEYKPLKHTTMGIMRMTRKNLRNAWEKAKTDRDTIDMVYCVVSLAMFTFGFWAWMWIVSWMM